jgi:hypothetical protein
VISGTIESRAQAATAPESSMPRFAQNARITRQRQRKGYA